MCQPRRRSRHSGNLHAGQAATKTGAMASAGCRCAGRRSSVLVVLRVPEGRPCAGVCAGHGDAGPYASTRNTQRPRPSGLVAPRPVAMVLYGSGVLHERRRGAWVVVLAYAVLIYVPCAAAGRPYCH